MRRRHETTSPEETEALAADLASSLTAGDVVLVEGDLGAGKTTFVRGACRALGIDAVVTSPTFTIGQRYPGRAGRVTVSHLDLFRIASLGDEADPELLGDYVGPDTIVFVEWPRDVRATLVGAARIAAQVRIEHGGGDLRTVEIDQP
jgi:tRNA threonylcarbamoyladenosine biosynthesis protein TsaE